MYNRDVRLQQSGTSSRVMSCSAALATEDPTPDLLLQKPAGRRESLISPHMWWHILTQVQLLPSCHCHCQCWSQT